MSFNESNSMFVISHNPKFDDGFRKISFEETFLIMRPYSTYIEISSLYPKSFQELEERILQLPGEWIRLLPNLQLGEKSRVITRQSIARVLLLWRKVYEFAFGHSVDTALPLRETRRFALHLHLWMALEEFLLSDRSLLFYFEDDVKLDSDFVRHARQVFDVLPDNFDVFNFAIKPDQLQYYNSGLQIDDSLVARNYHCATGAAIALSRNGARKMLQEMLLQVEHMPLDMNLSRNFDMVFSNAHYNSGHVANSYFVQFTSPYSSFQTYTFTPEFSSLAQVRFGNSSWWNS